ncbi:hypothetical protein [Bernardetia sp. MNP-M8]|uniref:hypothetical protein n=1 Tax=Bernardetia sp. MNP-M8 TaxID=3127470 RepID=UPI0030D4E681
MNILKKLSLAVLAISILSSCQKNDEVVPTTDAKEFKFINLLVSDANTNQLSLITPQTGLIRNYDAKFAKSALYATSSGRFAVLVHRAENFVETFDTGFETHSDHVDIKGTPKFGAITGSGILPTHFKSHGSEIAVFNDGDGTLLTANENDFHISGMKMTSVQVGNDAHHGAMAKFDNGSYAITEKDGSIAGTLPERVKIINTDGTLIAPSTIQTKGIHGNATNGKFAVFGSASGILVVGSDGEQKLINHPENFETAWFGTILEGKKVGKFIGYTAAKGAYFIDIQADKVTPIIENTDIMQCKVDYEGANLLVLLYSGELHIFDLVSGTLKNKAIVINQTDKTATQKPQLVGTQKYIYIASPNTGEIMQIQTSNLSNITKFKVGGTPTNLVILGTETSKGHD